jgi:hypothetical protein
MTHAFLQSELTSLISDSKRKYNDVRTAAEQSLADLKAISVTSETQLAGDLLRRPQFIDPFVLACKSKNAKLATSGTICLQRLTASSAVSRARLPDVLDAFHDGVNFGYEPQLKILQTLPSLLQLYGDDLRGEPLARTLEICAALQSSRTAVVSHTATATFQQLVSTVFERAGRSREVQPADEENENASEPSNEPSETTADDAVRLFRDFSLLLDQGQSQFLKVEALPSDFLLETLQTVFSTHPAFLTSNMDQLHDCWEHLTHGVSRILAKKDAFGQVVRAFSIVLLILQDYEDSLRSHLTRLFPSLLNTLEKEGNPPWKRALCLEFFRGICSDFTVLRNTFDLFDQGNSSEKVIGHFMSALVRIAAEDPFLIGLGRQSTIPVQSTNDIESEEAASIEAQGLGGAITTVSTGDSSTIGISMNWSVLHVPLMDQPEKQNPPAVPRTYLYTLVLGCIASLCDGLSKFVMPLSVPSRPTQRESLDETQGNASSTDLVEEGGQRKPIRNAASTSKYQRLVNPLTLIQHPQQYQIQACSALVESCWPAALATCSTFLNSALDSEFYHILIRSVQKLAQVSGVLELSTPRDALLTTLAKASIPTNANNIISTSQNARPPTRSGAPDHDNANGDIRSPTEPPSNPITQNAPQPLNVRHLLCLRALLNLGIALGPTLEQDAWFILIETLQTVEALIAIPSAGSMSSSLSSPRIGGSSSEGQATLAGEIAAVQAATKRMLESTKGYSLESFSIVVRSMFRLLGQSGLDEDSQQPEETIASPLSPTRLTPGRPSYRTSRRVSGLWTKSKTLDLEIGFVLSKISEISRINIHRFTSTSEGSCSWDLIARRLLNISQDSGFSGNHRLQSASVLDLISMETMKLLTDPRLDAAEAEEIRLRCLQALLEQLEPLDQNGTTRYDNIQSEVHKRLLEALESILSHSGDSLGSGWPVAFKILFRTVSESVNHSKDDSVSIEEEQNDEQNAQLLRLSFRSVQLIASDFLAVLSAESLSTLSQLLRQYGSQSYDLNVALTSTTLLWSLASQILTTIETIELETMPIADALPDRGDPKQTSTSAALWSITLLQLVALSKDPRLDVRNAAIRVLLRMLDASCESLSPSAWAVALTTGPLSAIEYGIAQCTSITAVESDWLASASQLTDGSIQLVCHNITTIVKHSGFKHTWSRIMHMFEAFLSMESLTASSLVFSNVSRLLSTLRTSGTIEKELLMPILKIWALHHPSKIDGESMSNQPAFTAHMHAVIEAHQTSSQAVTEFQLDDRDISALLMDAIEKTVLLCAHPPYTSDVKSLEAEQKEACQGLIILKGVLHDRATEYSQYLLRLVKLSLNIQSGKVGSQRKKSAIHKTAQKPTFIAFASACVENLNVLVLEQANDDNLIQTLAVRESFETLSALIDTKYTDLPTNTQTPLWRTATSTAVMLLGALQKHVTQNRDAKDIARLSQLPDSIIAAASSILEPGGLPNPPLKQKEETLLDDEIFDIENFRQFHAALISIFQHDEIGQDACQQYAITLFKASLLAKPWFYDLPEDLTNEPLQDLLSVRPGSLHQPAFVIRRRTCYTAMDALFELVQRPVHAHDRSVSSCSGLYKLARAASPYWLLRVVHPVKTFLADQRLRGMTPPPMPQQVELQTILAKFVELRSNDRALQDLSGKGKEKQQAGMSAGDGDGKEHLRILYAFMLRVQRFWQDLPRLKSQGAWQADGPGRGIDEALEQWSRVVGGDWGLR